MEQTKQANWYSELRKPTWSPPSYLFGPVWTILYVVIAVSFGYTAYFAWIGNMPAFLFLPFGLNLLFNVLFTPIQFGLKSNELAMLDIYLVLITLILSMVVVYPYMSWVAFINVPYLLWVSFATVLQTKITLMNRTVSSEKTSWR